MSIWTAIFLGIVQGVAEFLPISSSGHLAVLQNVFHMQTAEEGHMFFDVLLHLGTVIAILAVYWKDVKAIFSDSFAVLREAKLPAGQARSEHVGARFLLMIIIGTLPLFIILPFHDSLEQLYYNTRFIGIAFILTGFILFISDKMPQVGEYVTVDYDGKKVLGMVENLVRGNDALNIDLHDVDAIRTVYRDSSSPCNKSDYLITGNG